VARTTVILQRWAPALYRRRDATGDWGRLLAVLEAVLNNILSSQDTRAFLDLGELGTGAVDTVIEAQTEGEAGRAIRFAVTGRGERRRRFDRRRERRARRGHLHERHLDGRRRRGGDRRAHRQRSGDPDPHRQLAPRTGARRWRRHPRHAAPWRLPAGYVLGKIAIDAMSDLRDPLRTEARLLPYLGQNFGWDLDTSLPEPLQRKVLTLAEALFQEKGTKQGIVDALRLLLGLDVVYQEAWADGWVLNRSRLDDDTILAPAPTADGYAEGMLVAVDPGQLADNDTLLSVGWLTGMEFQKQAAGLALSAMGWLRCIEPSQIPDGLKLTLKKSTGPATRTFEFKRTATHQITGGNVAVNITTAVTAGDVATALAAAVNTDHGTGGATQVAVAGSTGIVILQDQFTGVSGNSPMTGDAFEMFDGIGMIGGAAPGAFVSSGLTAIHLIGATTAEDVARLIAFNLAWTNGLVVTRALAKVYLRNATAGAAGDGAITGTAASKLSATGMSGGVGVNPDVLSFRITFPRHLTDQELRTAIQVVDAMKRAETHWEYINPAATVLPLWRLDKTPLGLSRLAGSGGLAFVPLTGDFAADLFDRKIEETHRVSLGTTSLRTPRLSVGGRYVLVADDGCYIKQGNRVVTATTSDTFLSAETEFPITVTSTANAYVAVIRANGHPGTAYLRVSREDG
jgi:phage tail-like protein